MSDEKIIQENGENIMPITHETCVLDDEGNPITETIGDVSLLNTESRNLVGAINEVFGDTIKERVVDALLNKGSEITDNDSWVNIIDEINKLEVGGNKGLDIISATELPVIGRENQICVITDNPVNNFLITPNINDKVNDTSKIVVYQGTESDIPMLPVQNDNMETYYYIDKICQANDRLPSYIYQNNVWNTFTKPWVALLENAAYQNQSYHGGIAYGNNKHQYVKDTGITMYGNTNYHNLLTFANKIDLSLYSKVHVTFYLNVATTFTFALIQSTDVHNMSSSNFPSTFASVITSQQITGLVTPQTITFDISSINELVYFGFYHMLANNMVITDVKLS